MAYVLVLTNIKGGEGKTTSSVVIAYGLARRGKRVLLVDMCQQSNATYTILGEIMKTPENTIYEVLMKERDIREPDIIRPSPHPNLFIVPGTLWMTQAEVELVQAMGRELKLRTALEPVLDRVDYIVIDTPPSLGLLTTNALFASTHLLIPVQLEAYGLVGIEILLTSLELMRSNAIARALGITMPITGVLLTKVRLPLTNDAKGHLEEIQAYFGEKLFQTLIPLNVKVSEANGIQTPLYDYAPTSSGARAYSGLVEEVISRVERVEQQ
jgi:chromosome partitioning protein